MASRAKNGRTTSTPPKRTSAKTPIIEICESFCWGERSGADTGNGEQTQARRACCGEYDVTADSDMRVCNSHDGERFSLSIDAVYQHLIEGRMRLKNGRLPSVTHA